jgi:hypothetical protein
MKRLRLAWHVLCGRSIVHRCVLVLDGDQLLVAAQSGCGPLRSIDNVFGNRLTGPGEVCVFDWDKGLVYALYVEGENDI